jgi:hypothetical protein
MPEHPPFRVGDRVRLKPDVEPDVRDRYGEVVTIGRWLIHVQMTDTGQILAFQPDELELVRRRQ